MPSNAGQPQSQWPFYWQSRCANPDSLRRSLQAAGGCAASHLEGCGPPVVLEVGRREGHVRVLRHVLPAAEDSLVARQHHLRPVNRSTSPV